MSMARNPFAHLIPKQPVSGNMDDSADLAETEKWQKRGDKAAKNSDITPYLNPYEGRQMPEKSNQNPFAHLIPESGNASSSTRSYTKSYDTILSPNEEKDFQKWKEKNAPKDSGADYDLRGAFKAGFSADPKTGHWPDTFKKPNHPTFSDQSRYAKDEPGKAGRWEGEKYIPPGKSADTPNAPKPAIDINSMPGMAPWMFKKLMEIAPSMKRPMSQAIPENIVNLGRGFTEIGQGAKQAALGAGEYAGVVPYGTQSDYTKKTEEERKLFESTSAGKDPYGKNIRALTKEAPFYAATSAPIIGEAGLLTKMLLGGAGGGVARGTEYRKPGEDRAIEVAKGVGEGALMNAIPEIPGLIEKGVDKLAVFQDVSKLEAATQKAKQAYEAAQAEQQQAKSLAKQSPLKKSDPDTMLSDVNANQQKIANIDKELANQSEGQDNSIKYFMDTPDAAAGRLGKAESIHKQASEALASIKAQEKSLGDLALPETEKANAALADTDKRIAEHLDSGAEHHVKGAQIISKDLEANRKAISKDFDALEENTAKQKITLPPESKKTADDINAELRNLVSANKSDSKEATKLLEQLDKVGEKETIAANDYIATYRSTNAYMREAYKKGYQPGLNPEVQRHWQGVGDELKAKLGEMDAVLEKSLTGKDYELFKNTSTRWKNEVVPLYRNPVYRKMKGGKGKLPANAMEALAGNEEGNVLIRNAIQKNPEALKHVVGQKYDTATGRELVHTPNEQVAGYTSKMPELQKLIAERQNAQGGQQAVSQKYVQQREAIKQAREKAEAMQERAKKHMQMQTKAKTRADQMRKEHDTKLENIKNMKQQRASLEETNRLLDEHIKELKRTMANVNMTKEEHAKTASMLSKAQKKKDSVKSKLSWLLGTTAAGLIGGGLSRGSKSSSSKPAGEE